MKQKAITRKIFKEAISTLTALKSNPQMMEEMPIREIELHILDEEGEGVVLCLEFNEETKEIRRTFTATDENDAFESFEDGDYTPEDLDEMESEVLKSRGLLN